jgi:mannose-1-phosphate guanylyltransferase
MRSDNETQKRWAIILAGGEGKRLSPLTRRITGDARPKQFCSVIGNSSLIEQTRSRVSLSIADDHILAVVTRTHERYYVPLLRDMQRQNLIIQPENRGTGAAILHSLLRLVRLSKMAPSAYVALFPSDHFVSDDRQFMRHVDLAFDTLALRPELTVLLGIPADSAETGYGWIEPNQRLNIKPEIFSVRRFWEKPTASVATELLARGCLWNSFVIVARLSTLLDLLMLTVTDLYHAFAAVHSVLMTSSREQKVEQLYRSIESADFSQQVLATHPMNLAVLPVRGCRWSDLGEPDRVMNLMREMGITPVWHSERDRFSPLASAKDSFRENTSLRPPRGRHQECTFLMRKPQKDPGSL